MSYRAGFRNATATNLERNVRRRRSQDCVVDLLTPQELKTRFPSRLAFRSEGKGFSGGLVDGDERRGFNFEVDNDYFEQVVWPAVAHRFPAFEAARCHRTWSGLYEQNELDGNPVIGRWSRVRISIPLPAFPATG